MSQLLKSHIFFNQNCVDILNFQTLVCEYFIGAGRGGGGGEGRGGGCRRAVEPGVKEA
jgi:hypothetical protein